ncbi:MAG: hypothetical protein US89_C0007G0031 [Candidatus Peregrinibacteria bacterium GW2011_GWF2_38_29]|nr:MAG: hypothetical protein US89_C0007G0031 [Candidatus Peregrinibacteria bacterium GW2011_GWF2_38_29]HBB02848.1 hypothetical protein [Candidatus Peregrinibacteria bacterium]
MLTTNDDVGYGKALLGTQIERNTDRDEFCKIIARVLVEKKGNVATLVRDVLAQGGYGELEAVKGFSAYLRSAEVVDPDLEAELVALAEQARNRTNEALEDRQPTPKQQAVIQMLREQAGERVVGKRLSFKTPGTSSGIASCFATNINGKTDAQILAWMDLWGIDAELINDKTDLFSV